ncbi:MAG TPA: P1 family peptidase [Chloroflexota bacterium]
MSDTRPRARDIGLRLGGLPPAEWNAITDVAGVRVGHVSVMAESNVRTGVTAIQTHEGDPFDEKTVAAAFVLNGFGKTCGLPQLAECGTLETPILLTNTLSVPRVADAVLDWALKRHPEAQSINPLVGECNDAYLNDIRGRHVQPEHVWEAIETASDGAVAEGAVGAGVGMSCYGYKGGIGTASRRAEHSGSAHIVGALVLANFGRPEELMIDGVRIGELLASSDTAPALDGSVMVIVATDAPLDARQLGRLARRGALGLARTGSVAHHGSGDFVLTFTTAGRVPHRISGPLLPPRATVADAHPLMDTLFQAAVESVEEAVINALTRAETMVGRDGHVRQGLPLERVRELLMRAGRIRA